MENRTILTVTGADRAKFLQGLVSNDVPNTGAALTYAALLTPQGKYLVDFFLQAVPDQILIDVAHDMADALLTRLSMYKLRADVDINRSDLNVARGTGPAPTGALPDPRHPSLGWRLYSADTLPTDDTDWAEIRVINCIPESGIELIPNETYILEAGFERLNGVDFKKGCYVGQEVTARMKHKTELKKGFATVRVDGAAPVGTEILSNGKAAGVLYTQAGGLGIAYLRFVRAVGPMHAGDATVTYEKVD
ncbi:MAG: folate-binding protein [Paracoccaceae bacterium]